MSGVGRGSRATASSSDLALGACEKPGPSLRPQSGDGACFIFVSSELFICSGCFRLAHCFYTFTENQ